MSTSLLHFPSIGLSHSYLLLLSLRNTTEQQQQRTHRCLWCVWGCVFPHMVSSELYFIVLQSLSFCSSAESCSFRSRPDSLSRVSFILPTFTGFYIPFKGKTHCVCVLYHIYFWKAQWVFYIPLCSKESMWSGIWFAQWAKKNRCLLNPWARIWVSLSFFQTLPIAHFMAILCAHICGALEKARALPSLKLVLTSDQIKNKGLVLGCVQLSIVTKSY